METEGKKSIQRRTLLIVLFFLCASLFAYDFNQVNTSRSGMQINADPETKAVMIQDHGFEPNILMIPVNGTVAWTNKDEMLHTVTSDADLFDSHRIKVGSVFTYQFKTAGTYKYHCKYHSEMVATVIVQ